MPVTGEGFIKYANRTTRAVIQETRKSGTEYATLPSGLIVLGNAYDWEQVYEIDSDEDRLDVDKLLADIEAAR